MMNNISNHWSFNGTYLSSFGAVTELDSYLDLPPKRGGNIFIPYRDGKVHTPKYYDEKIVSFGLEISAASIYDLEVIFDNLKTALGGQSQHYLKNENFPGGARQALAEVVNILSPTRTPDPLVAKVVIQFLLADPYFRHVAQTSSTTTINANPKTFNLTNPGSAPERKAYLTLTGPLSHPTITNTTNSVAVEYDDTLANNTVHVHIDCADFSAINQAGTSVIGKILHSGDPCFMVLEPGVNAMSVADGTHTTGTVAISFYAPFL